MSAFVTLPSEVINMIFQKVEHIDDALNLANCCRTFKAHLSAQKDMIRVMRVIMENSNTHYNDIQLCCLITSATDARPEHGSNLDSFLSFYTPDVDQLNDDDVLDIVRLRQRIRSIQNLYLDRSIQDQYRRSNFPAYRSECSEIVEYMFDETPTATVASTNYFAAKRFSDAVVACWVLVEARKLVVEIRTPMQFLSKDYARYERILNSFWCESRMRTPLQTLDMLEVHDLIYGFLIRKVYYRAWPEDIEESAPVDRAWAIKLQRIGLCLSPMDAAWIGSAERELDDPTLWQTIPWDIGYCPLRYGEGPPALTRYGIDYLSFANLMEFNLGLDLLRLDEGELGATGSHNHLVEAWAHFRRNWPTTGRGSILWSLESSEDFLKRLVPEPKSESEFESEPEPEPKSFLVLEPREDPYPLIFSRKALEDYSLWLDETIDDRADVDETAESDDKDTDVLGTMDPFQQLSWLY